MRTLTREIINKLPSGTMMVLSKSPEMFKFYLDNINEIKTNSEKAFDAFNDMVFNDIIKPMKISYIDDSGNIIYNEFKYDKNNNVITILNQDGIAISQVFDDNNKLKLRFDPENYLQLYHYDFSGKTMNYKCLDKFNNEKYSLYFDYNDNGTLKYSYVYENNKPIFSYEYDYFGRLISIKDEYSDKESFSYNTYGEIEDYDIDGIELNDIEIIYN